jgi:hypothetical protein
LINPEDTPKFIQMESLEMEIFKGLKRPWEKY